MKTFRIPWGLGRNGTVASLGDTLFRYLSAGVALAVIALLAVITAILFIAAEESIRTFGVGFLGGTIWNPVPPEVLGAAPFVYGTLVVPKFVLEELQHIADSSDTLRRNRGRRGLEILARMQKESSTPIEIVDDDPKEISEVDAKLVALARARSKAILTNDFNLNRVAELQGIRVLNINSLANAVKPAVLPGEELRVRVIQEGKEAGQGVGFLDDGTMIVVEGGVRYIDKDLDVAVTRVLQTVAGRMIFAQPRLD